MKAPFFLILCLAWPQSPGSAQSTISTDDHTAYSANAGWIHFSWASEGSPNRPGINLFIGHFESYAHQKHLRLAQPFQRVKLPATKWNRPRTECRPCFFTLGKPHGGFRQSGAPSSIAFAEKLDDQWRTEVNFDGLSAGLSLSIPPDGTPAVSAGWLKPGNDDELIFKKRNPAGWKTWFPDPTAPKNRDNKLLGILPRRRVEHHLQG